MYYVNCITIGISFVTLKCIKLLHERVKETLNVKHTHRNYLSYNSLLKSTMYCYTTILGQFMNYICTTVKIVIIIMIITLFSVTTLKNFNYSYIRGPCFFYLWINTNFRKSWVRYGKSPSVRQLVKVSAGDPFFSDLFFFGTPIRNVRNRFRFHSKDVLTQSHTNTIE